MTDRPRQPGGADEAETDPGRAAPTAPADDSAALSTDIVLTDSDAGTEEQRKANAWMVEVLCERGLVVDIRDEDGEFIETPIGRAVDILLAQGGLTEGMARGLKILYEANVAMIGAAEHSTGWKSILEAIQRGSRKTLSDTSVEERPANEDYGDFFYNLNLDGGTTKVSIIEAIAWLESTELLNGTEAYYLRITCMENMRQTPYRKALERNLTPKEIEKELKYLDEKAREIVDPANDIAKIAALEAQLDEGDFSLHIHMRRGDVKDVDFLDGIFRYVQNKTLNMAVAIRLAKKCINEMLKHRHGRNEVIKNIEWIHGVELINDSELRQLLACIITDPEELDRRVTSAVDLSYDGEGDKKGDAPRVHGEDEAPAAQGSRTWSPQGLIAVRALDSDQGPAHGHDQIFVANPDIARTRRSSRLALVLAGFLIAGVGGMAALYTGLSRRPSTDARDTAAIASSAADAEPQTIDHARRASEDEEITAASAPAPTPAAPAPRPAPTPAPPQTIAIPVTTYRSGSGGFKVDTTDEARVAWQQMGYEVSVSMSFDGKKIVKLIDKNGNIYEFRVGTVDAAITELQATLQAAQ